MQNSTPITIRYDLSSNRNKIPIKMTDVCFSKPEILITLAWIEITTKFGLLVDIDLLQKTELLLLLFISLLLLCPRPYGRGSKLCFCLSVRPSVAYIPNNSSTRMPNVPNFGMRVRSHLLCDWHTTFKVKRSKIKVTMLTTG